MKGGKSVLQPQSTLFLQPQQVGAICQARPEADKNDKISLTKLAFPTGLIKGERNGSGRVVPIFFDRHNHLTLHRAIGEFQHGFEGLGGGSDDPYIGLMWYDLVDLME